MAIISFWSEGDKETGKTLSLAAITTQISIENTYKTLIFNTCLLYTSDAADE